MPAQVLTITINEQGQLNVSGPINNKLLAYGMLELAKECVAEHHRQQASGIVMPEPGDVRLMSGN